MNNKYQPIFVYNTPFVLINYENYEYLDYSVSPAEFFFRLKFLSQFSPVIVNGYPKLWWNRIKSMEFPNPIIILSQLKSRKGFKIQDLSPKNGFSPKKEEPTFKVNKLILNWYRYWRLKNVLSTKIEEKLHLLKWTQK